MKNLETTVAYYYNNEIVHQEIMLSTMDLREKISPSVRIVVTNAVTLELSDIDRICRNEQSQVKVNLEAHAGTHTTVYSLYQIHFHVVI